MRRVKAVYWWCRMNSGDSRTAAEKLATMPTDADIDLLYRTYSASPKHWDSGPSGATGPCGRSSTTETRSRGGSIDGENRRSIGTNFFPITRRFAVRSRMRGAAACKGPRNAVEMRRGASFGN